jgi:hypothetical protein
MHELAASQILELFRGRLPSQKFIPVRVPTKASDDVAIPAGLIGRKLEPRPELRGSLPNEFLRQLDHEIEVLELFRVPEGQHEECLLPGRFQSGVLTGGESPQSERQRLRIVRERSAASAVDGPRELVECNDQGESRASPMRPIIELASLRALQEHGKAANDLLVRSPTKPPFSLPQERMTIS